MPEHAAGDVKILDSGDRREFNTGAHRDRGEGKGLWQCFPYEAMLEIAKVFEAGAKKYTKENYLLGMPLSEYCNSMVRHAVKASRGWDDESHVAQCAWNCIAYLQTKNLIDRGILPSELDDVDNWLTDDGIRAALSRIRSENVQKSRAESKAMEEKEIGRDEDQS